MLKQIRKFHENKEGAFSLLTVIIVFIATLVAIGFIMILEKTWMLQETQSIMDVAGVSALSVGVDQQKLRVEEFEVDKSVIINTYKDIINRRFADSNRIHSYRFVQFEIEEFEEKWGLGITGKARPQVLLKSTIYMEIDSIPVISKIPGGSQTFYDSRSESDFTVHYLGLSDDGKDQILVRSVSRVVYR